MTGVNWEDVRSVVEPQVNAEGVHVWPFDAGFPIDVRFFRFARYGDVRPRRHDYFELLYMERGQLKAHIHDSQFDLRTGDLMVMNSTIYHSTSRVAGQPPALAVVLYFMPELITLSDHDGMNAGYLMPFHVQEAQFQHIIPASSSEPAEIAQFMRRIHAELPANSRRARLAVHTYLRMILMQVVNHYSSLKGTSEVFERRQVALERLKPLFAALEVNYAEPITLAEAAALVRLSKPRFMGLFKEATGSSFVHYLNGFRIAKAQQLLESTEMPIADIACEVGFCDQSYFGLIFRRHVNMTPLQYRFKATKLTDDLAHLSTRAS
ncbi:MAG: AraC family transcriptional regulator [Bryobacteraceae bacterium]|nr:AraC family transcriptional regulator [Bryobacteraceae bacterium]